WRRRRNHRTQYHNQRSRPISSGRPGLRRFIQATAIFTVDPRLRLGSIYLDPPPLASSDCASQEQPYEKPTSTNKTHRSSGGRQAWPRARRARRRSTTTEAIQIKVLLKVRMRSSASRPASATRQWVFRRSTAIRSASTTRESVQMRSTTTRPLDSLCSLATLRRSEERRVG